MFVFIRTAHAIEGYKNIILLFYIIMIIFVVNVYLSHTDQYYFIVFIYLVFYKPHTIGK